MPASVWSTHKLRRISQFFLDPSVISNQPHERPIGASSFCFLCNPYIFTHTRPYWIGRLHETGLEYFLAKHLLKGDSFIDVGANFGHVSMLVAKLLGSDVNIIAFEPNPVLARSIDEHFSKQGLSKVTVTNCALGESESLLTLTIPGAVSGLGNLLGRVDDDDHEGTESYSVQVKTADSILTEWLAQHRELKGRLVVKIDVEGFELSVLRGMREVLKEVSICIIEVSPNWIGGRDGVLDMWKLLARDGRDSFLLNENGSLTPISHDQISQQSNVVFKRI